MENKRLKSNLFEVLNIKINELFLFYYLPSVSIQIMYFTSQKQVRSKVGTKTSSIKIPRQGTTKEITKEIRRYINSD